MKMMLFFIISFIFLIPTEVNAVFCDYSELSKLKSLASNINYSYSYIESDNDVSFTIEFLNLKDNLILQDVYNNKLYTNENNDLIIEGYESGKSYLFIISTNETECINKELYSFTVNIPHYNKYYKLPICIDNPNIKLCDKWVNAPKDEQEFIDAVLSLISNEDTIEDVEKPTISFFDNYYIYILTIPITLIFILIYRAYNNRKDDFDLDTSR